MSHGVKEELRWKLQQNETVCMQDFAAVSLNNTLEIKLTMSNLDVGVVSNVLFHRICSVNRIRMAGSRDREDKGNGHCQLVFLIRKFILPRVMIWDSIK